MKVYLLYSSLVLFEQSNCIDWITYCYIRSLTEIYLFWYPIYVLHFELWEASFKSVDVLLTENIKRE